MCVFSMRNRMESFVCVCVGVQMYTCVLNGWETDLTNNTQGMCQFINYDENPKSAGKTHSISFCVPKWMFKLLPLICAPARQRDRGLAFSRRSAQMPLVIFSAMTTNIATNTDITTADNDNN